MADNAGRKRALIVDDSVFIAELMRRCLTMWGYEVDESHSVHAALQLFKQEHYDLALCDVDLQDGDGIFLARALSKVNRSLVVVMISGNPENIDRAREQGFKRYLRKPFDLGELKTLIDRDA